MRRLISSLIALATATVPLLATVYGPAAIAQTGNGMASKYHLIKKIAVPGDEGWDYLAIDPGSHHLFISRSTRVVVVDVESGKVVGEIPGTTGVHGIAIDAQAGRGFTSNGRSNTVTIFDLKTLAKIGDVPVGEGPDAILFDPATERVFTFNGRAQTATAIDAAKGVVVGTVTLPGRPEFAATDGKGYLYNNLEDKSEVAVIDAKTLKVTSVYPIAPGDGPSGIAIDAKRHHTFSVCDNNQMVVLDTESGKVIATPAIGSGPDAAAFDPATGLAFSTNGRDGTLSIVQESPSGTFETVATIKTELGARTVALDPMTHHIFTVTAKIMTAPTNTAPTQRRGRRYEPGTFEVLEYGP